MKTDLSIAFPPSCVCNICRVIPGDLPLRERWRMVSGLYIVRQAAMQSCIWYLYQWYFIARPWRDIFSAVGKLCPKYVCSTGLFLLTKKDTFLEVKLNKWICITKAARLRLLTTQSPFSPLGYGLVLVQCLVGLADFFWNLFHMYLVECIRFNNQTNIM